MSDFHTETSRSDDLENVTEWLEGFDEYNLEMLQKLLAINSQQLVNRRIEGESTLRELEVEFDITRSVLSRIGRGERGASESNFKTLILSYLDSKKTS